MDYIVLYCSELDSEYHIEHFSSLDNAKEFVQKISDTFSGYPCSFEVSIYESIVY